MRMVILRLVSVASSCQEGIDLFVNRARTLLDRCALVSESQVAPVFFVVDRE